MRLHSLEKLCNCLGIVFSNAWIENSCFHCPQEDVDLDVSVDKGLQKLIDTAGAGVSVTSPDWLTQLGRLWGGKSVRLCLLCIYP